MRQCRGPDFVKKEMLTQDLAGSLVVSSFICFFIFFEGREVFRVGVTLLTSLFFSAHHSDAGEVIPKFASTDVETGYVLADMEPADICLMHVCSAAFFLGNFLG